MYKLTLHLYFFTQLISHCLDRTYSILDDLEKNEAESGLDRRPAEKPWEASCTGKLKIPPGRSQWQTTSVGIAEDLEILM